MEGSLRIREKMGCNMLRTFWRNMVLVPGVAGLILVFTITDAPAVPSFGRQSGMDCISCHTVWPELTPFGRQFKMTGYTMSKSNKPYELPPPLSGLAQFSFTHTDKTLPPGTAGFNSRGNDDLGVPQELSAYYAGKIIYKLGAFCQGTYDGLSNKFLLDMTDIRYADTLKFGSKTLVYGFTVNNSPTVEDVWNSTPAFGFPFATSAVAPTPAAGAIVDGALDQQVGGIGLYAYYNNLLYAGVTFYRTARNGYTQWLGGGTVTEMLVDGVAPYWRVFLQHQWGKHSLMAGHYGMVTQIFPGGESRGSSDRFTDLAFDAQYQYIASKHKFSVASTFIHEIQDWNGSFSLGNTANRSDILDTFRINLNYSYRTDSYGTFGGNFAYFNKSGTRDDLLYAPDPVGGSRNGRPDSDGFIIQGIYVPPKWEQAKIVVQYTIYNNFNGASSNYDGFGRGAAGNNTLYILTWLMF
jgi:hypothetical protein